jgi:GNAT superfamily N-acetyltransferase
MFTDMGLTFDARELGEAFRAWLHAVMPAGTYRAWLADSADGGVAGGGGITIIPWPPGPRYAGDRLAFVYNVYTEPTQRRRGLARLIMETIHAWCRHEGIGSMALNASRDGKPLYEAMGYAESASPMMFLPIVRV